MSDLAQAELEVLIPLLQAQKRQLDGGSEAKLLVCDMLQRKMKGSTSTSAQKYFAVRLSLRLERFRRHLHLLRHQLLHLPAGGYVYTSCTCW